MIVAVILVLLVFGFSAYKVADYTIDTVESEKEADVLFEKGITVPKEKEVIVIEKANGQTGKKEEPIMVEIPFTVDFGELTAECSDIRGWLYCEDTGINYPVVQAEDNDKYLHMLPDGRYSYGGTLFIDCDNEPDLSDFNTVIYGHNMKNGTMFGKLSKYKKQEYFDEHPVMFYFTQDGSYLCELVAGFMTDADASFYYGLNGIRERREFLSMATESSTFKSGIEATEEDRYLTLSTCSSESQDARYVVVGKLTRLR